MARSGGGSRKNLAEAKTPEHRVGQPLATASSERKGVQNHRPDLLLDIGAQHGARAKEPRLDRLGPEPEQFGRLLDGHFLDHAADEDQAKGIWQFVDRALDDLLYFALSHGFFRIARCG